MRSFAFAAPLLAVALVLSAPAPALAAPAAPRIEVSRKGLIGAVTGAAIGTARGVVRLKSRAGDAVQKLRPFPGTLFWGAVGAGTRWLARRGGAPRWAPEAASVLAAGAAVHLLLDTVANTVALLWPIRRREYGLGLDHLAGVTDHAEYVRRYPASPAGRLELALVIAAIGACAAVAAKRHELAANGR